MPGDGIVHRSYSSSDNSWVNAFPKPKRNSLAVKRDRLVPVGRVTESRETGSQLRERQGQHALDLGRVDGHGGCAATLAEQLLGDEPAEGVAHDDRRLLEAVDDGREVARGVVDPNVGDGLRVVPGGLDGRAVRPASQERRAGSRPRGTPSTHGSQLVACSHRPWMKTTGRGDALGMPGDALGELSWVRLSGCALGHVEPGHPAVVWVQDRFACPIDNLPVCGRACWRLAVSGRAETVEPRCPDGALSEATVESGPAPGALLRCGRHGAALRSGRGPVVRQPAGGVQTDSQARGPAR